MRLCPAIFIHLLFFCIATDLCAQIRFGDEAATAGVADRGEANGAAFGDYSGDGLPDLFVARLGDDVQPLLYLNQGDGTFVDERATVAGSGSTLGGLFVDYDSDGDLDLYTVHFRDRNRIFENEGGKLVIRDRQDASGDNPSSTGAAFADYDGDGRLDLFTTNWSESSNQYYIRIYQEGFAELSRLHSALRSGRDSFGALPFDYDSDGDIDLYLSNWGFANLLFSNQGHGTFRQIARPTGLLDQGRSVAALPGDCDNDGDLDLYTVRGEGESNSLYLNTGGRFDEVAAGVEGAASSTGAAWADFDNDGDLDLLVSNLGATVLYENRGNRTFANISTLALPPSTQATSTNTAGITTADYDGDGDVDAFISGLGAADLLLRNNSPPARWLRLELTGRPGQTAVGSRVRLGTQLREYAAATQIGTVHGNELHFGLGLVSGEPVDLEIEWASGQRQSLRAVAVDQVLRLSEPVPRRDLKIDAVVEPGLAPRWRPHAFEVVVRNLGVEKVAGAHLRGLVAAQGAIQYEEALALPSLVAGESARVRFPTWIPRLGGTHRFDFVLEVEDDLAANNRWTRVHSLQHFTEVASESGVADEGAGFAGAWSDYDRDGDLDLYISNGGTMGNGINTFYRNDDNLGFAEIGAMSGVADVGNGTGVVFADFDHDGWEDLYIAKGGFTFTGEANRLFRNNRDGTFADVSAVSQLSVVQSSYAAAAGDYDQDGDLDLYVSQLRGQPNQLYRNDGRGGFDEVGSSRGIVSFYNFSGSAAAFGDYDLDGDLDLYATMYGTFDLFYADVGAESFAVADVGNSSTAVGIATGDYDNDGDVDIYVVNQGLRSALLRNDLEVVRFADVGEESGTDNHAPGAGCAFGDLDSDGNLDLYVVNGRGPDRVFMNHGDGTFTDRSLAYGLADTAWAWSVIMGDYDSDGDLDPYVINETAANRLYRNDGTDYNWLQTSVEGVQSNSDGIGTRLRLFADGKEWMREVIGTAGMSQSSRVEHFGLGSVSAVDSLLVHWPSGRMERYSNIRANSRLMLLEGQAITAVVEAAGTEATTFKLAANYPNPFNAATRIRYAVGVRTVLNLTVYNALGQWVRSLDGGDRDAGQYEVGWDGRDDAGRQVGSGVYFCRMQSANRTTTQPMVLVR